MTLEFFVGATDYQIDRLLERAGNGSASEVTDEESVLLARFVLELLENWGSRILDRTASAQDWRRDWTVPQDSRWMDFSQ